jgi:hypothetical protein
MLSGLDYVIVMLAAAAAGAVNALAGGGTLISFPVLLALGVPPIEANVTNTVALLPGYLGATIGQAADLRGQRRRLRLLIPIGAIGGVAGGVLLLSTGEETFRGLVPWLILLATGLVAIQKPVRGWVEKQAALRIQPPRATDASATTTPAPVMTTTPRPGLARRMGGASGEAGSGAHPRRRGVTGAEIWAIGATGVAAIYGGYFGAGLSVIVLAALGLTIGDTLTRLNAVKQVIALVVNAAAAVLFVFSGRTVWPVAAAMAIGAVAGGIAGGRVAGRVRPETLRRAVIAIGTVVGIAYLVR